MKIKTTLCFLLAFLTFFSCRDKQTNTTKQENTQNEASTKPVFDDGYPTQVSDVMLDSIFDFYFILQHKNLCERAKPRFEQQLKKVLSNKSIDSLALLQTHRRLAVVNTMYLDTLKAAYHITQALNLVEKLPRIEPIEKAKTYETKAVIHLNIGQNDSINSKNIFFWFEKALNLATHNLGKKHIFTILLRTRQQYSAFSDRSDIANTDTINSILSDLQNLPFSYPLIEGVLYLTKANILSNIYSETANALTVFIKSRMCLEAYSGNSPLYSELLSRTARCYYFVDDIKSAMELYELAANFGKEGFIKNTGSTVRDAFSMASTCAYLVGDNEKALHFALSAHETTPYFFMTSLQLARSYFNLKDYQNGKKYIDEVMFLLKNNKLNENHKYKSLEKLIYLYCKIGDVKNAEFCANLLDTNILALKNNEYSSFSILCAFANLYGMHQHKFDKGLRFLDAAYEFDELFQKTNTDIDNNFAVIALEQTRCNILFEKYSITKNASDLMAANRTLASVFKLWDIYTLTTNKQGAKQSSFLLFDNHDTFEQAIKSNIAAGDLNASFNWYESAQKQMLRINENDKISYEQFGIPKSLMEKERTLRNALAQLNQKVKQNKDIDVTTQNAFLDKKQALNDLLASLEKQYPNYYHFKYNSETASLPDIQCEVLDDQTALIEYFVGDSSIYVFTVLKNDLKATEIKKPKDFSKSIEAFRNEITRPQPLRDATTFVKQSTELYDLLLRRSISALPSTVTKLIIAPDDALSYLPFDILTSTNNQSPDFRQNDFLLKHYQISYAYSANLLLEQKQAKKHDTQHLFAGFAPKYEDKDTLVTSTHTSRAALTRDGAYELKGAKEEVQTINDLLGGQAFINESATEGVFKKEANQYRILHFAMHSLTDDKDPTFSKLLFTLTPKDTTNDNDLTAGELYAMQLNADLAVLSACNTGYGTINRGEGVMSLARAFTYAGVPATVTSLWKVPDLTTREIMVDFYKNLKQGMTKDAALRQAKLTYLDNAPESVAANPYFWAGFVPMGNMAAMDMTDSHPLSIWGILTGLILISGLVFGIWQKNRLNA